MSPPPPARPKGANTTGGLSSEKARELLAEFGPNEPAPAKNRSILTDLVRLFLNPLVILLLIAAIASGLLGQAVDSTIIVGIVLLSVTMDFTQTYRSEIAVKHLRDRVAPTATVFRDGRAQDIPRRDVAPGDIIQLSAGDLVPADARLLYARNLYVQQSALTGESMPSEKEALADGASAETDARNMVFLGSSVVSGTATAAVTATGPKTQFGAIAVRLAGRPPETAFDLGLKSFSVLITRTVVVLVLFLIVTSVALHRDPLQSLLFAVALAVGLTPEFLPMITSITLSKGAVAMARKKVIVKHLSAIQNLGSIDILCSDKTGTLTSGRMELDRALDPFGSDSERPFLLAWVNSKFETGIRSPLDTAILAREENEASGYEKLDEIPFDFERRRISIVVQHGPKRLLITKGAPEGIFSKLAGYELKGAVHPIDAETLQRSKATYDGLSRQGYRVLAVAYAEVDERDRYSTQDECALALAGFLTFADPPMPDAAGLLGALKRDGVELKIITGDSDLVSTHICSEVGLPTGQVVLGRDLETMVDSALGHVAETASLFARVSPVQKNQIILALKHRSHAVGYMGDGINDAPSLHTADVGISVSTGVDVARDAADIILVEPGLGVLHDGILEGRKAFGNVMKYLLMGTSSNFGNMVSMAGASLFLPFLPMLPTQVLLNNFLYDLAQIAIPTDNVDEEFLHNPQRWDISLIRKFMLFIGPISSIFDFLTFFVLLRFFHANEKQFHTGWFVESLATQTLVLFVIRTRRNPFRSRPSLPLTLTTAGAVVLGIALPFSPLAGPLGFSPLPASYFGFLAMATAVYLILVEVAKRRLMRVTS